MQISTEIRKLKKDLPLEDICLEGDFFDWVILFNIFCKKTIGSILKQ